MRSNISRILTYVIVLLTISCKTDVENQIITEKAGDDEGIRTVAYPKTFKNRESYSIYLQGLECVRKNDYDCCKEKFEKALAVDPNNHIILNDLGLTEKRLHNYVQAAGLFRKAIAFDSNYYAAYNNLGLNLYYDKKYDEAVQILKLVDIDSTNQIERRANYFHLLMNYSKLRNCDSAYQYYNLITEFATNNVFLENVENFKLNELQKNCP